MGLNIKDPQTEQLAADVADLAGENKTQAIRVALQERKERLELQQGRPRRRDLRRFLETEVWPLVPPDVLGTRLSKDEEEDILGIGGIGTPRS